MSITVLKTLKKLKNKNYNLCTKRKKLKKFENRENHELKGT